MTENIEQPVKPANDAHGYDVDAPYGRCHVDEREFPNYLPGCGHPLSRADDNAGRTTHLCYPDCCRG